MKPYHYYQHTPNVKSSDEYRGFWLFLKGRGESGGAIARLHIDYPLPAPEKNPHLSATSVGSFQRNKSLAGFVKYAARVKYGFAM